MKRKLDAALRANDTELLTQLDKEKEKLAKFKATAAKNFKKTCRKLIIRNYGETKWNPDEYDRLISTGLFGKSLLRHLGISHDQLDGKQKGNQGNYIGSSDSGKTSHELKNIQKIPILKDKKKESDAKNDKGDWHSSTHKKIIDQPQERKQGEKKRKTK